MTVTRLHREVWRVRRIGDSAPSWHRWGCVVDVVPNGLNVRIAAPEGSDGADLEEPESRLHAKLLRQLPQILCHGARSEVGMVSTRTWYNGRSLGVQESRYALATSADVLVTLTDHLAPELSTPWRGTCTLGDLDPNLPVALGPSAVLSLTAGLLEMPDEPVHAAAKPVTPSWMSVESVDRSPYPPHDCPPEIGGEPAWPAAPEPAAIAWWATRSEHWMRPMRTTRASRGQYRVQVTLPTVRIGPPALWIESLVSLDTLGRCWHASLSIARDGGRWWLTQPLTVDIRAHELLEATVGQIESSRPALDRDPVDGESFGWAPGLLTACTARELGLPRRST